MTKKERVNEIVWRKNDSDERVPYIKRKRTRGSDERD